MAKALAPVLEDPNRLVLNPKVLGGRAFEFSEGLRAKVIGQNPAIDAISAAYQMATVGMASPFKPMTVMLFMGPSGCGKTRTVEAAAELLFGSPHAMIKIDCAEFQHSHEIAKLIGSPPGYLGHRETPPLLTQENLEKYRTDRDPFTLVLFDEIEKASDSLWQLLLGVLDKATLTLGDNRRVDFSSTMIFMTSNLGAREMTNLIEGHIGFAPVKEEGIEEKVNKTAVEAAKKKFTPEFMNRIDKIVVFKNLSSSELNLILDLELANIRKRIEESLGPQFVFALMPEARQLLLEKGGEETAKDQRRYGARYLKRTLETEVMIPLANLSASGQLNTGDFLLIDVKKDENGSSELEFGLALAPMKAKA